MANFSKEENLTEELIVEEITLLEQEISAKQQRLDRLCRFLAKLRHSNTDAEGIDNESGGCLPRPSTNHHSSSTITSGLTNSEVDHYSRQLILPEIGVSGQLKLRDCSVLIVGAGGLGCPAACYLAAAGVGHLGIIDYDTVEVNNLHRQVMHSVDRVGRSKSVSLATSVRALNPHVRCECLVEQLNSGNALDIVSRHQVVLDCSDNLATRYLVNDACVLTGRPLISGSALRMEGMLLLYNYQDGPCYRCLFPTPPPAHAVTNCAEGGVLGTVPGVIGVLQAMEAIKLVLDLPVRGHQHMLLYDGWEGRFREIRLRGRSAQCVACGDGEPRVTALIDYTQFCGAAPSDKVRSINVLADEQRITSKMYKSDVIDANVKHVLLDVRPRVEYDICHIAPSVNVPFTEVKDSIPQLMEKLNSSKSNKLYVICHRGNDSQRAVNILTEQMRSLPAAADDFTIKDIIGGINSWALNVDNTCPIY